MLSTIACAFSSSSNQTSQKKRRNTNQTFLSTGNGLDLDMSNEKSPNVSKAKAYRNGKCLTSSENDDQFDHQTLAQTLAKPCDPLAHHQVHQNNEKGFSFSFFEVNVEEFSPLLC